MEIEAWLDRAASRAPGRVAIETPAGAWSYEQLAAHAHAGAGELAALGVAPGERVAIALAPGLGFAQALHACLLLGAVAVPVDLRLAEAERERITAGASVCVGQPLPEAAGAGAATGAGAAAGASGHASAAAPIRHRLDATALIVHTSGTTAAPRPVSLTYANLLWSALGSGVALGVDSNDRWLCTLPLSHVGGLSILIRSAIYATTAIVHERFETERALHALHHEGVTLVSLVATTLARLLDAGLSAPPALRCALTGGGSVPAALVERATRAGVPVSLTYGLTETCSQVTTTPVAELATRAGGDTPTAPTAGPPLFCTRLRIADDGEIEVSGPTVAPSAELRNGWLATGDLGTIDGRGRLQVAGRKSDTIVSGGENVAPAEVEAVLEAHPQVLEAAVLGRSDPQWGEAVTAIVVVAAGAAPTEEELRAHCAAALASYKVPKQFRLVAEPLPRTASGKLLRRALA